MLAGGACMITETAFPRSLFEAYAEGKLTRNAFVSYFSEWQKRNGVNFDCKGSADSKGVYVHYRGKKATIQGDLLVWCAGIKPARFGRRQLDWQSAKSVFEFCRKVDFALLKEKLWKGGCGCRELTL